MRAAAAAGRRGSKRRLRTDGLSAARLSTPSDAGGNSFQRGCARWTRFDEPQTRVGKERRLGHFFSNPRSIVSSLFRANAASPTFGVRLLLSPLPGGPGTGRALGSHERRESSKFSQIPLSGQNERRAPRRRSMLRRLRGVPLLVPGLESLRFRARRELSEIRRRDKFTKCLSSVADSEWARRDN